MALLRRRAPEGPPRGARGRMERVHCLRRIERPESRTSPHDVSHAATCLKASTNTWRLDVLPGATWRALGR